MHNGLILVLWQFSYLNAPTFSQEILCKFDQSGAKLSGMFRPVLRMKNQVQFVDISSKSDVNILMFMLLHFL